jgi:hypothetical protein
VSVKWLNLAGTVLPYLRLGKTGPRLKDSSGSLLIRNPADSADAVILPQSLGTGTRNGTKMLRDDGVWTFCREVLTADRTYYVRTDGNDSNTGLVNNSGGAFLTIQHAIDVACGLDMSIYNVTIQLANGTYSGTTNLMKSFLGSGELIIQGDTTTPANVLISTTSHCFNTAGAFLGVYRLRGMKLTSSGGNGIQVAHSGANVKYNAIDFGACAAGIHVFCSWGTLVATGNYSITGSAYNHIGCFNNGNVETTGITITLTGTPAWGGAYCRARAGGVAAVHSSTYSGAATGPRYDVSLNAVINVNGGGASFLPGNSAGSSASGGQYV